MRIVAGRFRGRGLAAPSGRTIRPTSDRLRETIFNILEHGHGDPITGARVLDLFAGTGAMGLEALSRGAEFCLFVDQGAEARSLMRASIEKLGCAEQARIFRRDATRLGAAKPLAPFSVVFCDPPYGRDLGEAALSSALAGGWIAPNAMIVVEEAASSEFVFPEGFIEIERRAQGDTMVGFAAAMSEAEPRSLINTDVETTPSAGSVPSGKNSSGECLCRVARHRPDHVQAASCLST